jgi:hypothetical protein
MARRKKTGAARAPDRLDPADVRMSGRPSSRYCTAATAIGWPPASVGTPAANAARL